MIARRGGTANISLRRGDRATAPFQDICIGVFSGGALRIGAKFEGPMAVSLWRDDGLIQIRTEIGEARRPVSEAGADA